MARSKGLSSPRYNLRYQDGRVAFANANLRLPRPLVVRVPLASPLLEIEDRRTFHPEYDFRPARSFNSSRHRLVVARPQRRPSPFHVPTQVAFHAPEKVLICVRRQRRREVLHALKKTGGRGGRQRRPRRNWYSQISC